VDQERVGPLSPGEMDTLFAILEENLAEYPVVILSDYGKGFISKEFMDRFMPLVQGRSTPPLVLVDPKTVNYDLYRGVDLLTPNTKEASEGANLPVSDRESVIEAGRAIFRRLDCRNLLITLGPDGMALFEGQGAIRHIPTFARKVFDVTGAGDTVIATTALALAAGMDLLTACTLANYAAGVVVAQVGAATATPDDLRETVNELPEPQVTFWQE
jgi:rfaE bifunctional protein kinase chain/domain